MKRILLVISAAVLFLSSFATPTALGVDGGTGNGTNCGSTVCKP